MNQNPDLDPKAVVAKAGDPKDPASMRDVILEELLPSPEARAAYAARMQELREKHSTLKQTLA